MSGKSFTQKTSEFVQKWNDEETPSLINSARGNNNNNQGNEVQINSKNETSNEAKNVHIAVYPIQSDKIQNQIFSDLIEPLNENMTNNLLLNSIDFINQQHENSM